MGSLPCVTGEGEGEPWWRRVRVKGERVKGEGERGKRD